MKAAILTCISQLFSHNVFPTQRSHPVVNIPLHATEHLYIVTQPMAGIDPMLPVMRDPDGGVYLREWNGGILAGGFEPKGKPVFYDKIPGKFEFQLLPDDWNQFGKFSLAVFMITFVLLRECL